MSSDYSLARIASAPLHPLQLRKLGASHALWLHERKYVVPLTRPSNVTSCRSLFPLFVFISKLPHFLPVMLGEKKKRRKTLKIQMVGLVYAFLIFYFYVQLTGQSCFYYTYSNTGSCLHSFVGSIQQKKRKKQQRWSI